MEHKKRNRSMIGLWIDNPFIFRVMRKWIIPSFAVAVTLMMGVYFVEDLYMEDTCTATAIVSILPRERTSRNLSDSNIQNAVTRNVDMWNSNSLRKLIEKENPDRKIRGSLHAYKVNGTNLVKIASTATTSQDAFYLLNEALRNYRKIIGNFDQTYLPMILTDTVKSGVRVIKPNPWKYAILIFAATFAGCLGLVGLWTITTDLLHCESQAEELLEVPFYEAIPRVRKRGQKAVRVTNPKISLDYLQSIDSVSSRMAQHMLRYGQKSVLFTSFGENEGKTTLATNVAINLAHHGNKTLLIDMDFRRPSIWKILDQKKEDMRSLSVLLENRQDIKNHIITREDLWNLDVLFQFAPVSNADQFLENSEMKERLQELSQDYDYIIVDTAPMGLIRDADVVAQMVDGSFLVIRQDYCRASMENDITDQMEEFNAPCMGAVLNCCRSIRKRPHIKNHYMDHYRKGARRS